MLGGLWQPLAVQMRKRRKGGWRQQRDQEELAEAEQQRWNISRLASGLLSSWGDGDASAAQVVKTSQNAVADGLVHPMVQRLAKLRAKQDANRDLLELLRTHTIAVDIVRPIAGAAAHNASTPSHVMLPSSYIVAMQAHYPLEFKRALGADQGLVSAFWTQMRARPETRSALGDHPLLNGLSEDELNCVVPLALHEDAGPVAKTLSAVAISFSSLLGRGPEKQTHFTCATYLKRKASETPDLLYGAHSLPTVCPSSMTLL